MDIPPKILQPSDPDWLTSLLSVILGLSASASYDHQFVGTSFVTTSDGTLITADHVAKELDDLWTRTRSASAAERARPGALYIPAVQPYLIPILDFKAFPNSAGMPTDLAMGQLSLPAGPNGDLHEMQSLEFSDAPVGVGDEVTMVGYLHGGESVDEVAQVIEVYGRLVAIPTVVVKVRDSIHQIPAPVFEMPCRMPAGMSGGPIFRTGTNGVVGVCSLGFVGEEVEPYCYGSTIQPLLSRLS